MVALIAFLVATDVFELKPSSSSATAVLLLLALRASSNTFTAFLLRETCEAGLPSRSSVGTAILSVLSSLGSFLGLHMLYTDLHVSDAILKTLLRAGAAPKMPPSAAFSLWVSPLSTFAGTIMPGTNSMGGSLSTKVVRCSRPKLLSPALGLRWLPISL